jgi:2Fe-2S ferredoxin
MVSTKTLQIKNISAQFEFKAGENLLDLLNANKVSIGQSCGGFGSCTTCRVVVINGLENCTERTEIEKERADERSFRNSERLACQVELIGSVVIEIP